MKKLLLTLLIVSIAAISKGSEKDSLETLTKYFVGSHPLVSYISKAEAQIPVVAILAIPENLTNISRYKELRASGVTMSYYHFLNAHDMQAALDMGQQAGIKVFVSCPELISDPETTVRRFMNHPALAGYFLADEPSRKDFSRLGELVKKIRAIDDKHICYVNLFPNYQVEKYLGVRTYEEYLENFIKEVPTQIISFDHYPIIGSTKRSVRPSFYKNLETISEASQRSGRPFWGFALSVAHAPYPVPTLGALRLQVYSNLAYGAQGIQYFTYWTPATPQFYIAAIGKDGKQTVVYQSLQQLNREIKGLSSVFLGAKMVSVNHTGNVKPMGTHALSKLPKPIVSLKTDGLGAVVSVMKNNGKSYLVIVNRDFTTPMNMWIRCIQGVSRVQKHGSSIKQNLSTNKVIVGPGDIVIYSWPYSMN
ncbi:MAG: beta-galactosidase [Pedobacter sp.]|uniref:beta-galactosidase n=1 Tax=Pedobacter sp. TaxID=1411316 RepID=UPI0035674280